MQTFQVGMEEMHVAPQIQEVLFRVFRIVVTQQEEDQRVASTFDGVSDNEMITQLERGGLSLARASGDGCTCLADSLLLLLVGAGFVSGDVDRRAACRENRLELGRHPTLAPRDGDGRRVPFAYLEHIRHAGPTVVFFARTYGSVDELPRAGVRVVIHARYDSAAP
ncbi:MAG: hypothetical protein VX686_03315, partial [Candidatus Thermoplasmatota archaeon]|nr:hypothetical protein [Candidatus Thermoplasmatota archaeon]